MPLGMKVAKSGLLTKSLTANDSLVAFCTEIRCSQFPDANNNCESPRNKNLHVEEDSYEDKYVAKENVRLLRTDFSEVSK